MKKGEGFLLAEGAIALLLVLVTAGTLGRALPGMALSLRRLHSRWELERSRRDLHTRLEANLLCVLAQARVVEGKHGAELEGYNRWNMARWSYFVAPSPSTGVAALYKATWNQDSPQPGVNPLTPPHMEVTGFAVEALSGQRIYWQLRLRHRQTGQETALVAVYRYGP